MNKVLILAALLATGGLFSVTSSAKAAYIFTEINVPGAYSTLAEGLNNLGQIVGFYTDAGGQHGFLYSRGSFTMINVAGEVPGINDAGQIVGFFGDRTGVHGFLVTGSSFTTIDVPGASTTFAYDINNSGQIAGNFSNRTGDHGFLYTGGNFISIDVPGAFGRTFAYGINDAGQIVGFFGNSTGNHGFLYTAGDFTIIDVPGSSTTSGGTVALDINDMGQIVGYFDDPTAVVQPHGFLYSSGSFVKFESTTLGQTLTSHAEGINDEGQIVGFFLDQSENTHGFLATPVAPVVPEPSSLALLGVGVIGLIFLRGRKLIKPAAARIV